MNSAREWCAVAVNGEAINASARIILAIFPSLVAPTAQRDLPGIGLAELRKGQASDTTQPTSKANRKDGGIVSSAAKYGPATS